jgi:hypothetical protein
MPSDEGYVKMWRSIDYSDIATEPDLRLLFLDLVRWANWKQKTLRSGITLERGQQIVSQVKLAELYKCSRSSVQRRLQALVKLNMIKTGHAAGQSGMLVTICNYNRYQCSTEEGGHETGQVAGRQRAGSGQVAGTEEEGKKERRKEGKNNTGQKRKRFVPPSVGEVKEFCEAHNLSVDAEQFVDYYSANGWVVGKTKMKDWHATARNWARRRQAHPNGGANGSYQKYLDDLIQQENAK